MNTKPFRLVSIALGLSLCVFLVGCPKISDEVLEAVQVAASVQQGFDAVYEGALQGVDDEVQDGVADKLELDINVDRVIDLDDDSSGSDIAPNAAGEIQLTGTLDVVTELETGSFEADELGALFLTDVVFGDPESGVKATFAADGVMIFSAAGSYAIGLDPRFGTELELGATIEGLKVATEDADGVVRDVTWDAALSVVSYYEDNIIIDGLPGTRELDLDLVTEVAWKEAGQDLAVKLEVLVDNATDPITEEVTVDVNGVVFGPYTLTEFADLFGVALGAAK